MNDSAIQNESVVTDKEPKAHCKKWLWFVLLFVIILAIGLGVIYYQFTQQIHQIINNTNNLQTQLQTVKQQQDDSKAVMSKLQQLASKYQDAWLLREVESLIQMADVTLRFQHDVSKTVALLKTADTHLSKITDSKLLNVRKLLADDIVALQAVPKVDSTGMYLRLKALDVQSEKLPLMTMPKLKNDSEQQKVTMTTQHSAWMKSLLTSWHAIQKVLVIRYHQEPVDPLLSFKQQNFLMLNLHLLFAQAEWALLQRQDKIYQVSLQQIQKKITQYFLQSSDVTQGMLRELAELQKIKINPQLPDISDSLDAMQHFNQKR